MHAAIRICLIVTIRLLEAVMRVMQTNFAPKSASMLQSSLGPPTEAHDASPAASALRYPHIPPAIHLVHRPPFAPALSQPLSSSIICFPQSYSPFIRVVSNVPGPQRRPPALHDLNIFATQADTIRFDSCNLLPPKLVPVPGVAGAFLILNVLSRSECDQLIACASTMGYTPDAVDGIDNVVWLADASLLDPITERVQQLMPVLGGRAGSASETFCGINARWRLFKYSPGAVYRPHIDGSWPGSGLDKEGKVTDDAFADGRASKLTFLIYLNGRCGADSETGGGDSGDGVDSSRFSGGSTTFFRSGQMLGSEGVRVVEATAVAPATGEHWRCNS